jgi:hypothetical protein
MRQKKKKNANCTNQYRPQGLRISGLKADSHNTYRQRYHSEWHRNINFSNCLLHSIGDSQQAHPMWIISAGVTWFSGNFRMHNLKCLQISPKILAMVVLFLDEESSSSKGKILLLRKCVWSGTSSIFLRYKSAWDGSRRRLLCGNFRRAYGGTEASYGITVLHIMN